MNLKFFSISLASVIVFLSTTGHANNTGSIKGNGGFVLTCNNKFGIQYRTLDLFEAENNRGFRIRHFMSDSPIEIALEAVSQLDNLSPARSRLYKQQIRDFYKQASFRSNIILTNVHDAYPIYVPFDCQIVQAATQTRYSLPSENHFFISNDIWDKLSPVDQAALLVHEIVYMEFGHELSVLARSFVGLLFSEQFANYQTPEQFLKLLTLVKAPSYEQQGLLIDLKSPYETYDSSGVIKKGKVLPGIYATKSAQYAHISGNVEFYKNGYPMYLSLDKDKNTSYYLDCLGILEILNLQDDKVYFYKNGNLWKANFLSRYNTLKNLCPQIMFAIDPKVAKFYMEENEFVGQVGSIELSPEGDLIQSEGLYVTYLRDWEAPYSLTGVIHYGEQYKPKDGILAEAARFKSSQGYILAEGHKPISFKPDGTIDCAVTRGKQVFEDKNRVYKVNSGEKVCL